MTTDSILMTVFNRPHRVLLNTLYALMRNDLRKTQIVIVDDGSTEDYNEIAQANWKVPIEWIRVNTIEDRPGTYNISGYNNPAYAWNIALEAAEADRITMLASDCIIPPHSMNHARRCGKRVWMSAVVDMDSGMQYLGPNRIAPYGWFMTWDRKHTGEIRQDEGLLKGIAFDDNDFTARLALAAGQVEIDLGIIAFHQSHPPTAYSDGGLGNDTNELYVRKKWGAIPWVGDGTDGPVRYRKVIDQDKIILHVSPAPTNS